MKKLSVREAYGDKLIDLGKKYDNLVVLEADIGNSSKSIKFGKEFPDRYFNVGIAELDMVGIASGMSTTGLIPFVNAFSVFMATRASDAVRSLVGYMNLNVKLAGAYSGVSSAYDGATHHSLEDIAFMRAVPNMTVICVADAIETAKAMEAAVEHEGPVYLRLCRAEVPVVFDESYEFEIGKGTVMKDGDDVTIISTGCLLSQALEAAQTLEKEGINARVVNMHTIKPIDRELIEKCAAETGRIVTMEEHSVTGGLGSAVAETVCQTKPVPVEIIGIEDRFTESGNYEELLEKYGLTPDTIIDRVHKLLK